MPLGQDNRNVCEHIEQKLLRISRRAVQSKCYSANQRQGISFRLALSSCSASPVIGAVARNVGGLRVPVERPLQVYCGAVGAVAVGGLKGGGYAWRADRGRNIGPYF